MFLNDVMSVFRTSGMRAAFTFWREKRALDRWCAEQDDVPPCAVIEAVGGKVQPDTWLLKAVAVLNKWMEPIGEKLDSDPDHHWWWMLCAHCLMMPRDLLFLIAEPRIVFRKFLGWPLVFAIWVTLVALIGAWPQLLGGTSYYTVRAQHFIVWRHWTDAEIARDDAKVKRAWSAANGKTLEEDHQPNFFESFPVEASLILIVCVSAFQFTKWLTKWSAVWGHIFMYTWYAVPLIPMLIVRGSESNYQTVTLPPGVDTSFYANDVTVIPHFIGFEFLARPLLWAIFAVISGFYLGLSGILKNWTSEPPQEPQPLGDARPAHEDELDKGGL